MSGLAISDTGFILGILSQRDEHHRWAVRQLESYKGPLLTCEAVLSEVMFLVRSRTHTDPSIVLSLVATGMLRIALALPDHLQRVHALCRKYGQRMSLADACLVRLSELYPSADVLTTDRADFEAYRRNEREPIPFVAP